MNKETIFFILITLWYLNRKRISKHLLLIYKKLFLYSKDFNNIWRFITIGDFDSDSDNSENDNMSDVDNEELRVEKVLPKYEDKFLSEIRNMEKDYVFNELEMEIKKEKYNEIIHKLVNESNISHENYKQKAQEESLAFIIKEHLRNIKNCFVMEHTPLGNVLMIYDLERETFKYYSDNAIPYRYLEVVGRKYVKQFNCRQIFVDMEDEIKFAEDRWEKERKEKEERDIEEKREKEEAIKNQKPIEVKKSVFAKFKSYNRESGTGHVNIAAPPKNSIPNKALTEKQENEKILLKDRANRYTYEGKFANFSFLKKADKKIFDNKLRISFSDFKKMQTNKEIN
jgi:hypothetical protein